MQEQELRDYLALWSISGIGSITARKLIAYAGSPGEVLRQKRKLLEKIPGIGPKLVKSIVNNNAYEVADKELEFSKKYNINISTINDDNYPLRLKECEDAPLILFTKGTPVDNNKKYISIVGTRNATQYGIDFCNRIVEEIKERGHDVVIVSGLAFGIDIAAHKSAVAHNLTTYGIIAHGLNTIYPAQHRKIATQMLENGGLITEFLHTMFPDKNNFVRRNRVIAGMSEATIIVESDSRGGALITANLANSYNRDVFAVPGKINDKYSRGTNMLIKTNRAALIESVDDLEYIMGWEIDKTPVQQKLFDDFTDEEQRIITLFDKNGEMRIDEICRQTEFPMAKVSALLLNMEFKGAVKCMPGKVFYKV